MPSKKNSLVALIKEQGYLVAKLAGKKGKPVTVKGSVVDGDTIKIDSGEPVSTRMLGIDAPETKSPLPGTELPFVATDNKDWKRILRDGFRAPELKAFKAELSDGLIKHFQKAFAADCAANHRAHANAAHRRLEELVEADIAQLHSTPELFQVYLAFSNEIKDRYGRLLCFIHPYQRNKPAGGARVPSYNERLLKEGFVLPYFIWPNVEPFRSKGGKLQAIPAPGKLRPILAPSGDLTKARTLVKKARKAGLGVYAKGNPLRLQAFELRMLTRLTPPERFVLDLSDPHAKRLIVPQEYYRVPFAEDRLFINVEDLPRWIAKGWKL